MLGFFSINSVLVAHLSEVFGSKLTLTETRSYHFYNVSNKSERALIGHSRTTLIPEPIMYSPDGYTIALGQDNVLREHSPHQLP